MTIYSQREEHEKNVNFLETLKQVRKAGGIGLNFLDASVFYLDNYYDFIFNNSKKFKIKNLKLRYATGIKNWYFYNTNIDSGDDCHAICKKNDLFKTFYSIAIQE